MLHPSRGRANPKGRAPHSRTSAHRRFVPALAGLVVLAAGCSPAPEPVDTRGELPDAFSRSGEAEPVDRWWRSFDDPKLTDLVTMALADRPQIQATWARLLQAEAVGGRTRADRFPSVDGTGEARVDDRSGQDEAERTYSLGLSASYELDLWGRIDATADAARLDARASRQQLRAAALTLSGEVADAWYRLVAQRARLNLLRRQLETNQKVETVVNVRVRQGQAALADLLRQRELVERTREQIATAEGEVRLIANELAVLLGRAAGEWTPPRRRSLPGVPSLPDTGVPADLLGRRPDVQEAVLRVKAADKRVAAAIADRFPRIDLTGSLTTQAKRPTSPMATVPANLFSIWLGNLASQLTVPLFDAGRRAAEVDRTQAVLAERVAQFRDTALTAIREVEDALARDRQQRRRVERLRRQIELAQQSLERLRGRYVNGNTDFLDVLDALTRVQDLERDLIDARRRRLAARIALARALAGGVTPPRPNGRGFDSVDMTTGAAQPRNSNDAPDVGDST